MLHQNVPTPVVSFFSQAPTPSDIALTLADWLKGICDANAVNTDGLSKSQASLIWQRQIALNIASRAYGMSTDHACLLQVMAEAERTVWDADAFDRLADDLMANAEMVADEWRGEAEALRGEI